MDFHIDKKLGLLLGITFILGGAIGGLLGVVVGHEGREFRDFRDRGNFPMMGYGRFGNDRGQEDGFGAVRQNLEVRGTITDPRMQPTSGTPIQPASGPTTTIK